MLRTDDLNLLMSPLPSYPLTILCTFFSINFHSKFITMEIKTKKTTKKTHPTVFKMTASNTNGLSIGKLSTRLTRTSHISCWLPSATIPTLFYCLYNQHDPGHKVVITKTNPIKSPTQDPLRKHLNKWSNFLYKCVSLV